MKWYLIDTDDGIIDEAEKKAILMWKYNFTHSRKCGKAYRILKDNSDGIGGNYWIVKEDNLKATGFEWVLEPDCCNCAHINESEPTIENCAGCYKKSNFVPKLKGE